MSNSLLSVHDAYRTALERQEAAALSALSQSYATAEDALSGAIERLARAVDDMDEPSAAKLFQLERYRILERQLADEMRRVTAAVEGTIVQAQAVSAVLGEQSAIAQVQAAFGDAYGQAAAEALRLTTLPTEQLTDLLGYLAEGSPLRASLDNLGPLASRQVRDGLVRGMVLGQGPRETARQVRAAFSGNQAAALSLARTSTLYAYRSSALRHYEANSEVVSGWVWNSALDRRTCMSCAMLHGRAFEHGEFMRAHRNCRCAASPRVIGSRVTIQRGADWFERQPDAVQREMLGPAGYEAYKRGDVDPEDFIGESHDKALGTVFTQRSLKSIVGERRQRELLQAAN